MDRVPALVTGDWTVSWLAWLDTAIEREIARLRVRYELSLDEFRGLYVSDEQVDRLIATHDLDRQSPSRAPSDFESPLYRVGALSGLSRAQLAVLFVAFAPELDSKYETLYAYLNDDVTRRHATVDLCMRLAGIEPAELDNRATLSCEGLIDVGPSAPGASWRSSPVAVRSPVRRALLGGLRPTAERPAPTCTVITGAPVGAARELAQARYQHLVEFELTETGTYIDDIVEARLHHAALFADLGRTTVGDARLTVALRRAITLGVALVVAAPALNAWRDLVSDLDHEVIVLEPPDAGARERIWRDELHAAALPPPPDLESTAEMFSLHPFQIRHAVRAAARDQGRTSLFVHARRQCRSALDQLAQRVPLTYEWSDLVLPARAERRLRELVSAIKHRSRIFSDWSFGRATGASLRVLFSGASGTGKTLSAAVVAREVGLDVFRIDLATMVSKYIGETEKNLERVFTAAAGSNAILFFDEADALFGKRSEVKDAHDRYANIEVAYLLQRMETYDGVLILATNLARNMDEAFSRRIAFEIDFPLPDVAERERLWRLHLPAPAPVADDVDYEFLARQFALTGGEVRNATVTAAFLAAHEGTDITMNHLVRAIARQRRKQGKIATVGEFGHYLAVVATDGT